MMVGKPRADENGVDVFDVEVFAGGRLNIGKPNRAVTGFDEPTDFLPALRRAISGNAESTGLFSPPDRETPVIVLFFARMRRRFDMRRTFAGADN